MSNEPALPDDYLWDRRGSPDPDVERLERLLAPLAHRAAAPARPARPRWSRAWLPALAAAALVAFLLRSTLPTSEVPSGAPGGSGLELTLVGTPGTLLERSWIEPQGQAQELRLGDVGQVRLEAGSRLEVRRLAADETRLYLERGRLHARVSAEARPRFFQVDTPATRCVDLGCRYVLDVNAAGDASVTVLTGQVAFENEGREVYVPAGATCRATRAHGAGTPRWERDTEELVEALDRFDAAPGDAAPTRRARASAVLAATTDVRASLAAWHLLQDGDADVARRARARLVELAGALEPPAPPDDEAPTPAERRRWKARLEPGWW